MLKYKTYLSRHAMTHVGVSLVRARTWDMVTSCMLLIVLYLDLVKINESELFCIVMGHIFQSEWNNN